MVSTEPAAEPFVGSVTAAGSVTTAGSITAAGSITDAGSAAAGSAASATTEVVDSATKASGRTRHKTALNMEVRFRPRIAVRVAPQKACGRNGCAIVMRHNPFGGAVGHQRHVRQPLL